MNVVVLCQKDNFVIPKNISLLEEIKEINVKAIFQISSEGSLVNKKELFFRGFGFHQTFRLGCIFIIFNLINVFDKLFSYKFCFLKSPAAAARYLDSNFFEVKNINSNKVKNFLIEENIDLIVSYSTPSILKKPLLDIPSKGCINLHCSLLPKFAGLLPSFWTLYEEEKFIGATIHFMDDKIDNGDILSQIKIPTPENISMYEAIKITKKLGGELMVKTIRKILIDQFERKSNLQKKEYYRSWPDFEDIKNFRKNGGKLI